MALPICFRLLQRENSKSLLTTGKTLPFTQCRLASLIITLTIDLGVITALVVGILGLLGTISLPAAASYAFIGFASLDLLLWVTLIIIPSIRNKVAKNNAALRRLKNPTIEV